MRRFAQQETEPKKERSGNLARRDPATIGPNGPEHPVLRLQRTVGNQSVLRSLEHNANERDRDSTDNRLVPQIRLNGNQPADTCEREAERVSDEVMTAPVHTAASSSASGIQRSSEQSAGESSAATDALPASVGQTLAGSGSPLETGIRQEMEERFGNDFSKVRVHSDAEAGQSARDVSAKAYTVGQNIVFGEGRFAPTTHEGKRLLAHELTHVVQQRDATPGGSQLARSPSDDLPARSHGLTKAEWEKIREVRKYFNLPDRPTESKPTIVGILILEDGEEIRIRSGEGGPEGGADRGGVPRGKGEAYSGGGPSQGNIETHVEGKATKIMHQRKIERATLLVEAAPCKVCDNPHATPGITKALPPGAKLRVVEPGSTGTYWSSQLPSGGVGRGSPPAPSGSSKLPEGSVFENKSQPPKGSVFEHGGESPFPKGSVFEPVSGSPLSKPPVGETAPVRNVTQRPSDPEIDLKIRKIDLSDYPPDKAGPVTGVFKDGQAIGRITAGINTGLDLASLATGKDLSLLGFVEWYFTTVIEQASKELNSKFPNTKELLDMAGMPYLVNDYTAAVNKLNARRNALIFEQVMATFLPEKDVEAALKAARERFARAGGGEGNWENYLNAAEAYTSAIFVLQEDLGDSPWTTLPAIADDINKRSSVLLRVGADLEQIFWDLLSSPLMLTPMTYYPTLQAAFEFKHIGSVFSSLGSQLGNLATAVSSRATEYQRLWNELEETLKNISRRTEILSVRYHLDNPKN
jgi:uncharacterized protein DUF4157